MAWKRANTWSHTKEKPYMINSYFFFFKIGKAKKSIGWAKYVYVCKWDMCWRSFCVFSLVTKTKWKVGQKIALFQMSAILKFDFQKKKRQLHFSEENYINYTKRHNFACDSYIFPKARANKNKQWTHLGIPLSIGLGSITRYPSIHATKILECYSDLRLVKVEWKTCCFAEMFRWLDWC